MGSKEDLTMTMSQLKSGTQGEGRRRRAPGKQCVSALTVLALAVGALTLGGCATTDSAAVAPSAEGDPLYDGVAPITFDNLLTGDAAGADFVALGDRAQRAGEQDKAIYAYLRGIQQGGEKALLFTRIAGIHKAKGNAVLAEQALQRALDADPDYVPALVGYGQSRLAKRDFQAAEDSFQKAIDLDWRRLEGGAPDKARAHTVEPGPAVESTKEAAEAQATGAGVYSPTMNTYDSQSPAGAYNGLGVLADLSGDYRRAVTYYTVAAAIRPNATNIINNLGYSYYLAGDLAAAERYFREVLQVDPSFERGWRNLALVYTRQERYDDALAVLSQIMDSAEAYNTLGYLCMVQGQHGRAQRFLEQAISLSPVYYELAYQNLEKSRLMSSTSVLE